MCLRLSRRSWTKRRTVQVNLHKSSGTVVLESPMLEEIAPEEPDYSVGFISSETNAHLLEHRFHVSNSSDATLQKEPRRNLLISNLQAKTRLKYRGALLTVHSVGLLES